MTDLTARIAARPVAAATDLYVRTVASDWPTREHRNEAIAAAEAALVAALDADERDCCATCPLTVAAGGATSSFDLVAHLHRQSAWSRRTFGPGDRLHGVTDHIAKELVEVRTAAPEDRLSEWVDVIILGLDGAWRSGATPEEIVAAIEAKQTRNEARTWPDWRTADPSRAIEHVRSQDVTLPAADLARVLDGGEG